MTTITPSFIELGNSQSSHFLIYLHGLDEPDPSPQELHNREVLAAVAAAHDLRIFCPRSCWQRDTGQLHWPNTDPVLRAELVQFFQQMIGVRASARSRFRVGALGFSNGGYFLSRLWLEGEAEFLDYAISFGAGMDPVEPVPGRRPPLAVLVGDQDIYHVEPARKASERLTARSLDHHFEIFSGGHQLYQVPIMRSIRSLTASDQNRRAVHSN